MQCTSFLLGPIVDHSFLLRILLKGTMIDGELTWSGTVSVLPFLASWLHFCEVSIHFHNILPYGWKKYTYHSLSSEIQMNKHCMWFASKFSISLCFKEVVKLILHLMLSFFNVFWIIEIFNRKLYNLLSWEIWQGPLAPKEVIRTKVISQRLPGWVQWRKGVLRAKFTSLLLFISLTTWVISQTIRDFW